MKKAGPKIVLYSSRVFWFESKNVAKNNDAVKKDKSFHCEDILEQNMNETETIGKGSIDIKPKSQNLENIKNYFSN